MIDKAIPRRDLRTPVIASEHSQLTSRLTSGKEHFLPLEETYPLFFPDVTVERPGITVANTDSAVFDDLYIVIQHQERLPFRKRLPSLERGELSFSGNERNHLFHNHHGDTFQEISGLSGLDTPQDDRTFAVWDFDRDGWQDIALLNINTPVLSLYRNQHGEIDSSETRRHNMVAFKFVGGNRVNQASKEFGPRDGYGVRVSLKLSDHTMVQQHRCGEGLGAQNSNTMFFGIGASKGVDSAQVVWPSGISQTLKDIATGSLVTVFENETETDAQSGFEVTRYLIDAKERRPSSVHVRKRLKLNHTANQNAQLTLYTSMATWCPNCVKRLPQLAMLRDHFSNDQLMLVGIPVDETDGKAKLTAYMKKHDPPYGLYRSISPAERQLFSESITQKIGADVLPATIIVGENGTVLPVVAGVPTVSDLKHLLDD